MSTLFSTSRVFRIFSVFALIALVFSQFVGAAQAQGTKPPQLPAKEKVQIAAPSLDEVQTYFGRLSQIQGKIGVVVELQDAPAIMSYIANQASGPTADLTRAQTALIAQKQDAFMRALSAKAIKYTELYRLQKVYNGIWLRIDSKDAPALLSIPGVKAIHPMIAKTLDHTTSVPLIGAPQVWDGLAGIAGEGMRVGIIDTGIDYVHTNFGGPGSSAYATQDFTTLTEPLNLFPTTKVVGGWDFAGDAYNADDASPIIAPDPDPMDCNGHGSHVAGTTAGNGVLADGSTYKDPYSSLAALSSSEYMAKFRIGPGVAPKASLYALRVFGCEGSTNLVAEAIEWAMDPNGDGDLSDHLDVINMSLGSSFGSAYDSDAVISNNAAEAGVVVVTSAGNSNDVFYIAGSPGMGKYTVDVASTIDGGAVVSAMEVTAPAAPDALNGLQAAVEAGFGPIPGIPGTTGDVVLTTPANGCSTISQDLTGKIALIDRGTCTFKTKVLNAQLKGAIGVIVANNTYGFPISMGNDATIVTPITIPSMMTTQTIGAAIKAKIAAPATVTVRLTSQYQNQFLMTDPSVVDLVSSFSSRGPARGTYLKPDIAAPGDSIFSTATGTGDQGASFNGTSMASPHVAGVMALLRQLHPSWSVAELKALAMNTATNDTFTTPAHTTRYSPTRVGAGRVSVANAAKSDVVAYYSNDPGVVSISFGEVEVVGTQDLVKEFTLSNHANDPVSYTVGFDSLYQANPGLTFTLLDGSGAPLVNPVVVPSLGTLQLQVKAGIDATLLARSFDPSIAGASLPSSRQRFSEGGGYITFTSADTAPTLRLPVHIAARPASSMSTGLSGLSLPLAPAGSISLTPTGTPVDKIDDTSLVTVLNLMAESPDDPESFGTNDAADLQYVGVTSDYPLYSFAKSTAFFGVSTYGKWDTTTAVEFDIYIDNNQDGIWDYVVFNANQGFFTGTTDDVQLATYCDLNAGGCNADYYTNYWSGSTNTNLYNNNVMVLPVDLASIGVNPPVAQPIRNGGGGNPPAAFDFQVVTFNREAVGPVDVSPVMTFDPMNQPFSGVDLVNTGEPQWLDASIYSPTIDLSYDKAAIASSHALGLLLLHHHNAANTAEALRLPPLVSSITSASPNPTDKNQVDYTVTFSNNVTGVDLGDFALTTSGVTGASLVGLTGSGSTYTVTVNTGSKTGKVRLDLRDNNTITDASGNRLGGAALGDGDYTNGDTYLVFKPATFVDVPSTYWSWSWVELLHEAGVTTGCSTLPMMYCPEQQVTRAQMAIFLLRGIHGKDYVPPAANGNVFTDVKPGDFAAAWIEQLFTEGITTGCGGSKFCPNDNVTRAQMAIFLLRSKNGSSYTPPAATGTMFSDVGATDFAADWIEQLAADGITTGCSAGKYCPNDSVTRAQMAVFLVRTFNLWP